MIGTPSVIVKAMLVAVPVPPPPAAVRLAVNAPFVVGVPVIAPVLALSDNPAGSPVAVHDVAGRSSASSRVGACVNATPTLPVKLCPAVILGAPIAIEIVAVVAALVPPGPAAVSVIVALPLSCGVPVIAPVVAFSVAQLGSPVAAQLVAGRFVLSVREKVLLKAVPTTPEAVCDAVMIGTPGKIVIDKVLESFPPGPFAVTVTV
jgi:hypothetical protein